MKKLITIGIILMVLGLVGFKAYQVHNPEKFPEPVKVSEAPQAVETPTMANNIQPSVQINVNAPIDGTRKGVVEIGASGFNAFVVSIDKQKNWELIDKKFGKSGAYEGFLNPDDAWTGIKEYILSMTSDFAVNGKNVHFVISSGALKNEKTKYIIDALKKKNYVVNQVTAEEEGKYALRALLPKEYMNNGFVVDIGSGNTKISWYQGTGIKALEGSGAKYSQNGKSHESVRQEIIDLAKQVPVNKREYCFIIGGVPHTLADQTRQGQERFTTLQGPDFYNAGNDEKLKAGLNIYGGILDGTQTQNVIFDWDANFTIGFLLTLN